MISTFRVWTRSKRKLAATLYDAKFGHLLAQSRQSAYNAQKYRPHEFRPADMIWLDKRYITDAIYKIQTSKKLDSRRFGPFKILTLIGKNAVLI